jgi:hypothetical protein
MLTLAQSSVPQNFDYATFFRHFCPLKFISNFGSIRANGHDPLSDCLVV